MPAANEDKIDLMQFIRQQRGERQPTFVVLGPPLSGKSAFAQQLAQQAEIGYLNVLDAVASQSDLAGHIEQFDIVALKRLILDRIDVNSHTALLIDDVDFLFPTWNDVLPFKEMVRLLKHPDRPIVFGFFLQSQSAFEDWELLRSDRHSRVLHLEGIRSL